MVADKYQFQTIFTMLITPSQGSSRLGIPLRLPEDKVFKEIRESIALDSQYFRSGQGQPAAWPTIVEKSLELLQKSKDLEVLVWLIRGLVKIKGLIGLRDGFMLLRVFHHEYWEEHRTRKPEDVGGLTWCLGRIDWLNDKLEADISDLVLFDPLGLPTDESLDAIQAQQQAQAATALPYYREQELLLAQAQIEYRWLILVLEKKYVGDAMTHPVSLSRAQARLQGRGLELEGLIAKKSSPPSGALTKAGAPKALTPSAESIAAPASRDVALAMLGAAADYLAQTEPLSPVPHLIRRAVRWARGSLQDWLAEIMGHRNAELETIYQTLDMKASEADK